MDVVLEVLKWVLVVLIAGFIGQFGRTLSHYVMDLVKKRKAKGTSNEPLELHEPKRISSEIPETKGNESEGMLPSTKKEDETQQLKAEKKLLKTQQKAKKKAEKLKIKG